MQPRKLALVLCAGLACRSESREQPSVAAAIEPEPEPEPKMIPGRDPLPAPSTDPAVDLPPPPPPATLAIPEVPTTYEDGAYSVTGLREDLEARLAEGRADRLITVRGFVQRIVLPAPACPRAGSCAPPHFWMTDAPDIHGSRRAVLVGPHSYPIPDWDQEMWAGEPELVLAVGESLECKGRFVRVSKLGLEHPRGLLELVACRRGVGDWIYPPGASWHPKALEPAGDP